MREIIIRLSKDYALYRGYGKLAVLFLAALICLIFIYKENRGRIHPLLFVVSVYTGIATALTELIERAFKQKDALRKNRYIYGVLAVLFAVFAVTLSGSRIPFSDKTDSKEAISSRMTDISNTASYLLEMDDEPLILADADVTCELMAYSSHIKPMYRFEGLDRLDDMELTEHKLYEAITQLHPSMEQITRLAHKNGHYYVLIDNTISWPKKVEEGKCTLINTIGCIDIYEYGGNAHE